VNAIQFPAGSWIRKAFTLSGAGLYVACEVLLDNIDSSFTGAIPTEVFAGTDPESPPDDADGVYMADAVYASFIDSTITFNEPNWSTDWYWGDDAGTPPYNGHWFYIERWFPPTGGVGWIRIDGKSIVESLSADGKVHFHNLGTNAGLPMEGAAFGDLFGAASPGAVWIGRIKIGTTIKGSEILAFDPTTAPDLSPFVTSGTPALAAPPVALPASTFSLPMTTGKARSIGDIKAPWETLPVPVPDPLPFTYSALWKAFQGTDSIYVRAVLRFSQATLNIWELDSNIRQGSVFDVPYLFQVNDDIGTDSPVDQVHPDCWTMTPIPQVAPLPKNEVAASSSNTVPLNVTTVGATGGTDAEVIFVAVLHDSSTTASISGYTLLKQSSLNAGKRLSLLYKVAGASEPDPTITFSGSCRSLAYSYVTYPGALDGTSVEDSAVTVWLNSQNAFEFPSLATSHGTTGTADAPLSGMSGPADHVIIAVAVKGGNDPTGPFYPPQGSWILAFGGYLTTETIFFDTVDPSFPNTLGGFRSGDGSSADPGSLWEVIATGPCLMGNLVNVWAGDISVPLLGHLEVDQDHVVELWLDTDGSGYLKVDGVQVNQPPGTGLVAPSFSGGYWSFFAGQLEQARGSTEYPITKDAVLAMGDIRVGTSDGGNEITDWLAAVRSILSDDWGIESDVRRSSGANIWATF
jgi:hypothetical protein